MIKPDMTLASLGTCMLVKWLSPAGLHLFCLLCQWVWQPSSVWPAPSPNSRAHLWKQHPSRRVLEVPPSGPLLSLGFCTMPVGTAAQTEMRGLQSWLSIAGAAA